MKEVLTAFGIPSGGAVEHTARPEGSKPHEAEGCKDASYLGLVCYVQ